MSLVAAIPEHLRHRLTVEEYHRMGEAGIFREGDRVELIEGEVIDMAPIGSRHAGIVDLLAQRLIRSVADTAIVRVQGPVILGDDSEPEPDLSVLQPRDDFYVGAHPGAGQILLLVEVADSSLEYDRRIKLPLYARHSIPEVWLVDLRERRVEVHREPDPARAAFTRVEVHRGGLLHAQRVAAEIELDALLRT